MRQNSRQCNSCSQELFLPVSYLILARWEFPHRGVLDLQCWKALYPSFQLPKPLTPLALTWVSSKTQVSNPPHRAMEFPSTTRQIQLPWLFWPVTNHSDQHLSNSGMYFFPRVLSSCSSLSGPLLCITPELALLCKLSDSDLSLQIILECLALSPPPWPCARWIL